MILDMGKDMVHSLNKIAAMEDKNIDIVALEMIAIGVRIYMASLEKRECEKNDIEPLRNILKTTIINQEILGEILTIIFNKERSRIGAYDAESALKLAEKMAEKYISGGEKL